MKIIKCLTELIGEELADAKKYAELALTYAADQPDASKLFRELSDEEMRHMERLHKCAERAVDEHRKTKGDPPAEMLAVYNYLHQRHVAEAKEVKIMQGMFDAR